MRTLPVAMALSLATVSTAALAGQTPDEPNLILTIFAGALPGHDLWRVRKQPLVVEGTDTTASPQYDTLDLTRRVGASVALGLQAIYFVRRHVGLELDISYLGVPYHSACTGVLFHTDTLNRNRQVCSNIDGSARGGSAIAFYGGLNLRPWAGRSVNPYVRLGVGLASVTQSSVDVSGAYFRPDGAQRVRSVVIDDHPRRLSASLLAGGGLTVRVGTGYQARIEARDVVVGLSRVDAPANALGQAAVSTWYHHRMVYTLGLDIVLERTRGRRY